MIGPDRLIDAKTVWKQIMNKAMREEQSIIRRTNLTPDESIHQARKHAFEEAAQIVDDTEWATALWVWWEEFHTEFATEFECGWKCSRCGEYPDHNGWEADCYDYAPEMRYCPNCGARMVGCKNEMDTEARSSEPVEVCSF